MTLESFRQLSPADQLTYVRTQGTCVSPSADARGITLYYIASGGFFVELLRTAAVEAVVYRSFPASVPL